MTQKNKIYVGNLPYGIDNAQLEEMFGPYGAIQEVTVIQDRETGRSKGFAFVTFNEQAAAESALEQNGKEIGGRTLRVSFAQDKNDRGSGGGRGGQFRDRRSSRW